MSFATHHASTTPKKEATLARASHNRFHGFCHDLPSYGESRREKRKLRFTGLCVTHARTVYVLYCTHTYIPSSMCVHLHRICGRGALLLFMRSPEPVGLFRSCMFIRIIISHKVAGWSGLQNDKTGFGYENREKKDKLFFVVMNFALARWERDGNIKWKWKTFMSAYIHDTHNTGGQILEVV